MRKRLAASIILCAAMTLTGGCSSFMMAPEAWKNLSSGSIGQEYGVVFFSIRVPLRFRNLAITAGEYQSKQEEESLFRAFTQGATIRFNIVTNREESINPSGAVYAYRIPVGKYQITGLSVAVRSGYRHLRTKHIFKVEPNSIHYIGQLSFSSTRTDRGYILTVTSNGADIEVFLKREKGYVREDIRVSIAIADPDQ